MKTLLARAHFNGTLELLTAAWERVLGYGRQEFIGKTLREFLGSGKPGAAVAAILDRRNMEPVELTLRCRDGQSASLLSQRSALGRGLGYDRQRRDEEPAAVMTLAELELVTRPASFASSLPD